MSRDLVSAEWIKLRSLRSTPLVVLLGSLLAVGLGALMCHSMASAWAGLPLSQRLAFDPVGASLVGLGSLATLVFGALGTLAASGEYASGLIRVTFLASPRRIPVLLGKATVVGALALAVGEVVSFTAFFVGQSMLAAVHEGVSLTTPGALRATIYGGVYISAVSLVGLAVGALVRHVAGSVATVFALTWVLPAMLKNALPKPWSYEVFRLTLPGLQMTSARVNPQEHLLSPTISLLVCLGWVVVGLGLAALVVTRRDA